MYTTLALLGAAVFLVIGHGQAFPMRWCTVSSKETAKCTAFKTPLEKLANESSLSVDVSCVQGESAVDCMKKIQKGDADLITLDGGEIYLAGKTYEMIPIVGEDYGEGFGTSYFAVAVVKRSNKDIKFTNLKGKKSCHTGAGKTAGWNVPIGTLLKMKLMMPDESCNPYVAAGKYFSESCVPNVKSSAFDAKNQNPDNLCALCKAECSKAGNYSGYGGAFQCLKDGKGEVAFVKHTTVESYGNPKDYQYLCTDGNRNDEPNSCYLAKVPSHAVMTKTGSSNIGNYQDLLIKASDMYGTNQTDPNKFRLFNSSKYGGKDLLFKDSTKKLVDVGNQNTYELWLGDAYLKDLEALNSCPTTEGPTAGARSNKLKVAVAVFSFIALLIAGFK